MYIDPKVDYRILKAANVKHDTTKHTVCMWWPAKYKGGFGYPVEPGDKPRRKVKRYFDRDGKYVIEVDGKQYFLT